MAVIARTRHQLAAPQVVDAAVANVRPIGGTELHQAQRDGGARPVLQRDLGAELHHLAVRRAETHVQETERIEQRLAGGAEALRDALQGDFGGALALGVAAHAVAGDQQGGLACHFGADPVLVAVACAQKAEFSVFDAQAGSGTLG